MDRFKMNAALFELGMIDTRCGIDRPSRSRRHTTRVSPLATLNKKGHMCSTRRAIEILEDGIAYEDKKFQLPKGKLPVPTANPWLRTLRIRNGRKFREFVPIHFRAEHSNQLWQMDVSPSPERPLTCLPTPHLSNTVPGPQNRLGGPEKGRDQQ